MYEADWLVCETPEPMLEFLGEQASDRKLRLFACGCVRRVWRLLRDVRSRAAVRGAEMYADNDHLNIARRQIAAEEAVFASVGMTSRKAARAAAHAIFDRHTTLWAGHDSPQERRQRHAENLAHFRSAAHDAAQARALSAKSPDKQAVFAEEQCEQADLLRCIAGNPFAPIVIASSWLEWRDGLLFQTAWHIYDKRRFEEMPIFGDALEDAGCTDEDILRHCREPGPHARGCHVLDAILGHDDDPLCGQEWLRLPDRTLLGV
jgi:hypothetical protein